MGSPPEPAPLQPSAAEALARVVLRCRELTTLLETSLPTLPARADFPFLHGQLDDVMRRLRGALRAYGEEPAPAEKTGFLRRLTGKKPRAEQALPPCSDLEGSARTIPVSELVGFLSHSDKSGLLWVLTPRETFVLEFARGKLVHATSNAPPAAMRLGEILVREKLLPSHELAQAIDQARAAGDLLGGYLVRSGRLSQADLQRVLAVQVQELFHRLMDAQDALFRFQEGGQLLRSQSLAVNITHLLLESARKKDERRAREAEARARGAGASDPGGPLPQSQPFPERELEVGARPGESRPGLSAGSVPDR